MFYYVSIQNSADISNNRFFSYVFKFMKKKVNLKLKTISRIIDS